jgi:putative cell wall-binding protein
VATNPPARRPALARLAVVALAAGLVAPPAPAAAQDRPAVLDVRPLPGDLATPGTGLDALVLGDVAPSAVEIRVDGSALAHTSRDDARGTRVRASLDGLAPGDHRVEVMVDGEVARGWDVTSTRRSQARLAGGDRFATAVAVSRDVHAAGTAPAAVLARSDDFADALAGAPLAAHLGGPLLLTLPDTLPAVTAAELDRALPDGAPVHVLGGTAAVGTGVAAAVEAMGHPVRRHAGPDRYATAARIADQLPPADTAIVAAGRRFPDALAASVPAAREGWPVLLTESDRLSDATRDALGATARAVVVGGTVAVSREVEAALDEVAADVDRVSGPTRWDTAVAIADRWLPDADEVALASGRDYPDALAAAARAADRAAPLLLADPTQLPGPTGEALRRTRPDRVVVHGGAAAVAPDVADAALRAAVDGPDGPRVVRTDPASGAESPTIAPVVVELDRTIDDTSVVASAALDGAELPTTARVSDDGRTVVVDPLSPGDLPLDRPHGVRVVVRAETTGGATLHHTSRFVLREDDHVFATVGDLELVEPSAAVEVIGYHQSNHEGAQQMTPTADSPEWHTMASRGRLTGSRTSADVVADEGVEVVAPVTGRVLRAGTYVLYCDHTDDYVVIEPEGMPGIEAKVLHFRGLRVSPGQWVTAGETVIGDGPRRLPFSSQVDDYSDSGYGPHVHVEVVDTSIPNVPNGGSGSEDC